MLFRRFHFGRVERWEDRIEATNVLKTEKYSDLAKDLEDSGF